LRVTVPAEIRQAQRLLKEREQIIGAAQDEAGKILDAARQQAEYVVSQQGVLNEARQRAEELLRDVEISHRRSLGQIDQYALEQFTKLEAALQDGLHVIASVVQEITAELEDAKRNIGR
jgi:vacuolar-type H+-ATPase subunit H